MFGGLISQAEVVAMAMAMAVGGWRLAVARGPVRFVRGRLPADDAATEAY